jgi:hypothetical protein
MMALIFAKTPGQEAYIIARKAKPTWPLLKPCRVVKTMEMDSIMQ